jgi:hypothetical protein
LRILRSRFMALLLVSWMPWREGVSSTRSAAPSSISTENETIHTLQCEFAPGPSANSQEKYLSPQRIKEHNTKLKQVHYKILEQKATPGPKQQHGYCSDKVVHTRTSSIDLHASPGPTTWISSLLCGFFIRYQLREARPPCHARHQHWLQSRMNDPKPQHRSVWLALVPLASRFPEH